MKKYFEIFLLVVISTYQEPIRGWIDNLYGPTGVAAGAGTGLLRSIHCDGSVSANVVPADLTINALIACAWDIANIRYIFIVNIIFCIDANVMQYLTIYDIITKKCCWTYNLNNDVLCVV